jgi:5-methylcytosine-specific restriction endonuclease McrA
MPRALRSGEGKKQGGRSTFLHQDKMQELRSNWQKENPEYLKEWRDKNRHLHNGKENKRRAAKKSNGIYFVSHKELQKLYSSSCVKCNSSEEIQMDHIIPISKGGRHSIGNIQPLCKKCNNSKRDKFMFEWKVNLRMCG